MHIILGAMRDDEELTVSVGVKGLSLMIADYDDEGSPFRLLLNQDTPLEEVKQLVECLEYAIEGPKHSKVCLLHNQDVDSKGEVVRAYFRYTTEGPSNHNVVCSLKNLDGVPVSIVLKWGEVHDLIEILQGYFDLEFQTQLEEE